MVSSHLATWKFSPQNIAAQPRIGGEIILNIEFPDYYFEALRVGFVVFMGTS